MLDILLSVVSSFSFRHLLDIIEFIFVTGTSNLARTFISNIFGASKKVNSNHGNINGATPKLYSRRTSDQRRDFLDRINIFTSY